MRIRFQFFRALVFSYLICSSFAGYSQSTFTQVYQLLNSVTCGNNFSSCHNSAAPSGLNFNQSEAQVYNNLLNQTPNNSVAAAAGNKLVYPGHPYRSFLFRKINNGLAYNVDLENGEGADMPQSSPPLNNKQIELIRQWIIYGAPQTGIVADTALIRQFYDNSGIESVTNPPLAPADNEGFQLHLGPYFLSPASENLGLTGAPFNRFDVHLTDTVEINRIECYVGTGFHHLGFFNYPDTGLNSQLPYGIIPGQSLFPILDFNLLENMATFQHSDTMALPGGTAYNFPHNTPLFIADHYQNYSQTNVLACDVYLNVYYQPENTAAQLMHHQSHNYSDNPNNPPLMIPPDGQNHTFLENIFSPSGGQTRYIWAIMAHSHNLTQTHDIYLRNANGTPGQKIYEGGCPGGIPGCPSPVFQPQDIPTRYNSNFITLNTANGLFREAVFRNNTPDTVFSGMYANEEMMAMAYYYITDTAGVFPSSVFETATTEKISIYPNPAKEQITIAWKKNNDSSPFTLRIIEPSGNVLYKIENLKDGNYTLKNETFPAPGIYFFELQSPALHYTGKFICY